MLLAFQPSHTYRHTRAALHLIVIEIPFTPLLLAWESNMKWFNSVIKTGNEIRVCDEIHNTTLKILCRSLSADP